MSSETLEWLNRNVLVGMTDQRGTAWHYRKSDQGDEPNHYPGPIPVGDVERRLFDWEAVAVPVYLGIPGSEEAQLQDDVQGLITSDTHNRLAIHGPKYTIHQYKRWLIGGVANLIDDELVISSAGLLKERRQAWVEISLPETISGPGEVKFRPNLLAFTSHDASLASTFKRTVTMVVCDNTLRAATNEDSRNVRILHTLNSELRIAEAREALELVFEEADAFSAKVDRLLRWKVSPADWENLLVKMVPVKGEGKATQTRAFERRDAINSLYRSDKRVAPWKGTAFGVVQAFNTWHQHERPLRSGTISAERNMSNAIKGVGEARDVAVLRVLEGVQ